MLDVSPTTLRTWEERDGAAVPERSAWFPTFVLARQRRASCVSSASILKSASSHIQPEGIVLGDPFGLDQIFN